MPTDIYTPHTLAQVLNRTPDMPSFLKDTFFKGTKTFLTEDVSFDVKKGRRTITPFVAPNSTAPVSQRTGYKTITYTPAQKKEKRSITANDIKVRLAGEQPFAGIVSPEERAVELLAQDMQELKDNLVRSQEAMAADLLFTGKLHVKGQNINDEIDFGFTNKETLSSSARWGQTSADIIADIARWQTNCLKASGFKPNSLVMDTQTAEVLMSDDKILKLLDNRRTEFGLIKSEELGAGAMYLGFLAGQLNLNLYIYENWYVDPNDNTEKPFVPEKTILLASDQAAFTKLYGANTIIPNDADGFKTYEGEYVARKFVQRDPDAAYLELQSRPLYVPHDVDSFFIAEVL